jgi:hypothetical protein
MDMGAVSVFYPYFYFLYKFAYFLEDYAYVVYSKKYSLIK